MERCRSACLEGGRHVIRVRLGLGDDAAHPLDHSDGILSHRRLTREHDRVCAVEDGVGDVGDLRACGHGVRDHAFHHLPSARVGRLLNAELCGGVWTRGTRGAAAKGVVAEDVVVEGVVAEGVG